MTIKKTHKTVLCVALAVVFLTLSGFWGKTKKDIDVKGVKKVAVAPFEYARFKHFSEKAGEIVPKTMSKVFAKKCKWTMLELDAVQGGMKELKISEKKTMTQAQAKALGEHLDVDLVIFGNLPTYDESETSREIQESAGQAFVENDAEGTFFIENMRELRVEYTVFFLTVSDGEIVFNEVLEAKERDTAKDPMMPDPPDVQLKHATTTIAKKLAKRCILD